MFRYLIFSLLLLSTLQFDPQYIFPFLNLKLNDSYTKGGNTITLTEAKFKVTEYKDHLDQSQQLLHIDIDYSYSGAETGSATTSTVI
jgi:hypothetical protein